MDNLEKLCRIFDVAGIDKQTCMEKFGLTTIDQLPFCVGTRSKDEQACSKEECVFNENCTTITDLCISGKYPDIVGLVKSRFSDIALNIDKASEEAVEEALEQFSKNIKVIVPTVTEKIIDDSKVEENNIVSEYFANKTDEIVSCDCIAPEEAKPEETIDIVDDNPIEAEILQEELDDIEFNKSLDNPIETVGPDDVSPINFENLEVEAPVNTEKSLSTTLPYSKNGYKIEIFITSLNKNNKNKITLNMNTESIISEDNIYKGLDESDFVDIDEDKEEEIEGEIKEDVEEENTEDKVSKNIIIVHAKKIKNKFKESNEIVLDSDERIIVMLKEYFKGLKCSQITLNKVLIWIRKQNIKTSLKQLKVIIPKLEDIAVFNTDNEIFTIK